MINLLYYKNIVANSIQQFIEKHQDSFSRINDYYVLSSLQSKDELKKELYSYIVFNIKKYVYAFDVVKPEYYFIIGSCLPKDNIIYTHRSNNCYFPAKLSKLIQSSNIVKYVLKESDILIDIQLLNQIFIEIFNELFQNSKIRCKKLGKDYQNVIFIQNKIIDCYAIFKILKYTFGNSNCQNIWKNRSSEFSNCIISLNDIISKYSNNKLEISKLEEFQNQAKEVKQYATTMLKQIEEIHGKK